MKTNTSSKQYTNLNQHPEGRYAHETNDCVVQAITRVFDIPYQTAHDICKRAGRKDRKGVSTYEVVNLLRNNPTELLKYGIEKVDYTYLRNSDNPPTIHRFIQNNKDNGNYIIITPGHAQSLVNGTAYNAFRKRAKVRYFFKINYTMAKQKTIGGNQLTANELRSVAATKGIKVIGAKTEDLLKEVYVPEVGEKVMIAKRKDQPMITLTYLGLFKCKTTNVYYAKMKDNNGKRYIKQLIKLVKINNDDTNQAN